MSRLVDARPRTEPLIDTQIPHWARMWNYWLGGKDNYPVDRDAGDQALTICPAIANDGRQSRYVLARALRHLAGEVGIRRFIDVGVGLPTVDNTHEIVQRVAPDCQIIYVDNDPLVLSHARALLISRPEGEVRVEDTDIRDAAAVKEILVDTRHLFGDGEPVAVVLANVLPYLPDDQARALVDGLMAPLPHGSHLVISHPTGGDSWQQAMNQLKYAGAGEVVPRSPDQLAAFFNGLELLEPGVVSCSLWRPEPNPFGETPVVQQYAGVGRKLRSGT
ncbi:SAM-dependent methyltransferase [Actinomadura napierensis]|uniref:SAM-dependent methyltransferase n=2 Tax=Actinomadura napierensis TaxID=267854 RepID=A0ABN2ZWD9_9ACTN